MIEEKDRNKLYAWESIKTLPMQGAKGPNAFVSALAGGFDAGERSNYVSMMLRYPYGPFMIAACERLNATLLPAKGDELRLRYIGNNYQLTRYPYESGASFELRCGLAWDLHGEGGTSIAVRKALEAYGFPQIDILEECYYPVVADGAEYMWAEGVFVGPNYGELSIDGCILGQAILDGDGAYLGTGNFSRDQINGVIRAILEQCQVHDCPLYIAFRFGTPPILDLCILDSVQLDESRHGAEYALIKSSHLLDTVCLEETIDGFGF